MFDTLFEDDYQNTYNNTLNNSNCELELKNPPKPKQKSNFVGLFNQGGTCYMNSSLQILYMNPTFRKFLYSLNISEDDENRKNKLLLAFQKLFIELNFIDTDSIRTNKLTETFNWNNSEGLEQQDSQEFIRLFIFDIFYKILVEQNLNYESFDKLFKLTYITTMKCSNCQNTKEKTENEYVLPVQVFHLKSLNQSLSYSFSNIDTIEDYKCEKCNKKTILLKWSKFDDDSLPKYFNIGLNRFTYNFETLERIKINDKFEFPLEINLKEYCFKQNKGDLYYQYELYGIINHTGTPYSGHYYAYIRDLSEQGNWYISVNDNNNFNKTESEQSLKQKDQIEEEIENHNDKQNWNENKSKKNKKNRKNKKNIKQKQDDNHDNQTVNENDSEFPIPFINKDLANNWFEFNDSIVTPIKIGSINKVFKSSNSAYMLFYIKKSVADEIKNNNKITLENLNNEVLKNYISKINKEIKEERDEYEREIKCIKIKLYDETDFNIYDNENKFLVVKQDNHKIEIKIDFNHTLNELIKENNINIKNDNSKIYIFDYDRNNYLVTLIKEITIKDLINETIQNLGFIMGSRFVIVQNKFNNFTQKIGENYRLIHLRIFYEDISIVHIDYGNITVSELKQKLLNKLNIKSDDYVNYDILYKNGNGSEVILDENKIIDRKTKKEKTILELNLHSKKQLTLIKRQIIENSNINANEDDLNNEELINIYCHILNEDENEQHFKISPNSTFEQLFKDIKTLFKIEEDTKIRLRTLINGKLIQKHQMKDQLNTSPIFIEGEVRIQIEFGETYLDDEIMLKIIISKKKFNIPETREYIINPEKTTIKTIKEMAFNDLDKLNKQENNNEQKNVKDYLLFDINMNEEPCKAYKNENITIMQAKIKDQETLYLNNISNSVEFNALIDVYLSDLNRYDICENFTEIDDNLFKEFHFLKINSIRELKTEIVKSTTYENIDPNLIRLRFIGNKNEPERVVYEKDKSDMNLKKFNAISPIKLLMEILPQPYIYTKNSILLVFMLRDSKKKTYYNKSVQMIELNDCALDSEILYKKCREFSQWNNISIAKYFRGFFKWEILNEFDNKGKPIKLNKGSCIIRSSDWIGIRNDDEKDNLNDNFLTDVDINAAEILKQSKQNTINKNKSKKSTQEKGIIINLED